MIHTPKTLEDLSRLLEGVASGKLVICDREDVKPGTHCDRWGEAKPNVGGGDQPPRDKGETFRDEASGAVGRRYGPSPQVGGGDQPPRGRE